MKKLNSKEAFEQLMRNDAPIGDYVPDELRDVEEGFAKGRGAERVSRPVWKKFLYWGGVGLLMITGVVAVGLFYWWISQEAERGGGDVIGKTVKERAPVVMSEEEVKERIEKNLRAFLLASNTQERGKFVYRSDEEMWRMKLYYRRRKSMDSPLWKIERIEQETPDSEGIWYVVYRDLRGEQHLASFQRSGDDYLLHWSAMTAFCELSWSKFVVTRPREPVEMRGYLRRYTGVFPVGVSEDDYLCFLIEDPEGLFSELAMMKVGAVGARELSALPKSSKHPVTIELCYRVMQGRERPVLTINSLVHLRWQK